MLLNLQRGKVIIWDRRSVLQVVQRLKLWDLQALQGLSSAMDKEESIQTGTY